MKAARRRHSTHKPRRRRKQPKPGWDRLPAHFVGLRRSEFWRVVERVPYSACDEATGTVWPARAIDVFTVLQPVGVPAFTVTVKGCVAMYRRYER